MGIKRKSHTLRGTLGRLKRAVVVYSLEYWPVVHDVADSIPANLMDGE